MTLAPRYFFVSPTSVAHNRRGGANICSLAYLQALSDYAPGRVTLVSPCRTAQMPELPTGVDRVIELPERPTFTKLRMLLSGRAVDRLSPFVDQLLKKSDLRDSVFFMNSSRGGRFSAWLRARGVPTITLFHNVESIYYASSEPNPVRRKLLVRASRWNDCLAFRHSSASIFLSEFDASLLRRQAVQELPDAIAAPNGFFSPKPLPGDVTGLAPSTRREILVNCSLGADQNLPGLMAFLHHWRAAAAHPVLSDVSVILAGLSPPSRLLALAQGCPRVRVVSDPSDAEMESLFASCRVCVSTIEAGSGIKVRIAEALKRGRPVVATHHSCIGYESIDASVLRRAELSSMMLHLIEVMGAPTSEKLEILARNEFERKLSFEAGSGAFIRILESVNRTLR